MFKLVWVPKVLSVGNGNFGRYMDWNAHVSSLELNWNVCNCLSCTNIVEGIFCSFVAMFIFVFPCLHKHFRTIFNVTFCISISPFSLARGGSNSSHSTHLTRSAFWVPARDKNNYHITHTVSRNAIILQTENVEQNMFGMIFISCTNYLRDFEFYFVSSLKTDFVPKAFDKSLSRTMLEGKKHKKTTDVVLLIYWTLKYWHYTLHDITKCS